MPPSWRMSRAIEWRRNERKLRDELGPGAVQNPSVIRRRGSFRSSPASAHFVQAHLNRRAPLSCKCTRGSGALCELRLTDPTEPRRPLLPRTEYTQQREQTHAAIRELTSLRPFEAGLSRGRPKRVGLLLQSNGEMEQAVAAFIWRHNSTQNPDVHNNWGLAFLTPETAKSGRRVSAGNPVALEDGGYIGNLGAPIYRLQISIRPWPSFSKL